MGSVVLVVLLRAVSLVVWGLPTPVARVCAAGIGGVLGRVGFRRRVIDANLERFGEPHPTPRQAYTHLGRLFVELLLHFYPARSGSESMLKRWARAHTELVGLEHWQRARAEGRGVLLLSSHVGNWELMAAGGALRGIDILLVTKRLKPDALHACVERSRASCGVQATYEPRTLKDVLRHLKQGGTVGMVIDQYAGPPVGVRVPFFGVPVGTHSAPALIAERTGAPVLPVINYRKANGDYRIEIGAPLDLSAVRAQSDSDGGRLVWLTQQLSQAIEAHIRRVPEQWLWTHRRFKGELGPLAPEERALGRRRETIVRPAGS